MAGGITGAIRLLPLPIILSGDVDVRPIGMEYLNWRWNITMPKAGNRAAVSALHD